MKDFARAALRARALAFAADSVSEDPTTRPPVISTIFQGLGPLRFSTRTGIRWTLRIGLAAPLPNFRQNLIGIRRFASKPELVSPTKRLKYARAVVGNSYLAIGLDCYRPDLLTHHYRLHGVNLITTCAGQIVPRLCATGGAPLHTGQY